MTDDSIPRRVALNLLAAAACAGLGRLCLLLWPQQALWLPPGLGVFLLLAKGSRVLPGVWFGLALATPAANPYASAVAGAAEAAGAWLAAGLWRRLLPAGLTADTLAPARFLIIAYACPAVPALFGPLAIRAFGGSASGDLDTAIVSWWLGSALGILMLVPALCELWEASRAGAVFGRQGAAMAAVAAATVAFGAFTFVGDVAVLPNAQLQAALLLAPVTLLTMRCAPAVPFAVNLALAAELAHGANGAFGELLGVEGTDRVRALHGFVLLADAVVLFLAAHIAGVRRIAASAQAGEERFRRMTALTSDWYWEQNADFRFTRMEGELPSDGDGALQSRFLGRRRQELPGFEPYNMSWEAHQAELDAHRTFLGLVLRHVRADGSVRYYSISGEPLFDATGKFSGYRGVGRDVTSEIESREALLASERRFHDVAEATFEGLFVHDYGRLVFVNRACAEMAGRSVEDLIGRSLLEFVAPEEHERIVRHMADSDTTKHYETVAMTASGSRLPVEIFGRPVLFQGKPMRLVAIRDNSERRRTEGALKAQIEFQRTLLDTIPHPVFYKDRNGRYLGYNRAFAEFLGIAGDQFVGKTVCDLIPGETGRLAAANDATLLAGTGESQLEESLDTPHGRRDVVVYKEVFHDESGAPAGLVGVMVDITERKRSEERLRRFHELSPAAIGIVSTSGEVLYMNPAADELFGYHIEDVPNMEVWWQTAYPDPAYRADRYAAWIDAVERTLREGRQMFRFDGRVHCMDGRDRWIETMVSLGEDEIFMIFTDLTDYVEPALSGTPLAEQPGVRSVPAE